MTESKTNSGWTEQIVEHPAWETIKGWRDIDSQVGITNTGVDLIIDGAEAPVILDYSESIVDVSSIPTVDCKWIIYYDKKTRLLKYWDISVENQNIYTYWRLHIVTENGDFMHVRGGKIYINNAVDLGIPNNVCLFTTLNGEDILVLDDKLMLTVYNTRDHKTIRSIKHQNRWENADTFKLDNENNIYYLTYEWWNYYLYFNETRILLDEMKRIYHYSNLNMVLRVTSPRDIEINYYTTNGSEFVKHSLKFKINENAPEIVKAREDEAEKQKRINAIIEICNDNDLDAEWIEKLLLLNEQIRQLSIDNSHLRYKVGLLRDALSNQRVLPEKTKQGGNEIPKTFSIIKLFRDILKRLKATNNDKNQLK